MLKKQIIFTIFLLVVSNCVAQFAEKKRSLFGIELNRKGNSLLKKVEKKYDKKVKEEWLEGSLQAGNSKVSDDGTPIIYINYNTGRELDVIIHELYHFIQRDEGYPVIQWLFPNVMNNEENQKAFNQLTMQMHDPILHYIFFPVIREWGINPNGSVERGTIQMLKNGSLLQAYDKMDSNAIALYYFMIKLNFEDKSLFNQLKEIIGQKGKNEGLRLGEQLTQLVIEANPKSPQEDINVLIKCLNTLYQDKFIFKQHEWKSRKLGNHIQNIAPIEIQLL